MDGAGRGLPPHFAEIQLDPLGKVFSRPMLPALIALNPRATNRNSVKVKGGHQILIDRRKWLCKIKFNFAGKMKSDKISNHEAKRWTRKKELCKPKLGRDVTFR